MLGGSENFSNFLVRLHENIDAKTFSIGKRDQDVGIQSANFNMEKKMLMH